ncbi:MAG: hypothetical protein ACREA2_08875 [Blastocatellia bacterium]
MRRAPYKLTVNRKLVQRVMRDEQISCRVKRRTIQTTDSKHAFPRYPNPVADLEITRPDQVWVSDITYIRLREVAGATESCCARKKKELVCPVLWVHYTEIKNRKLQFFYLMPSPQTWRNALIRL